VVETHPNGNSPAELPGEEQKTGSFYFDPQAPLHRLIERYQQQGERAVGHGVNFVEGLINDINDPDKQGFLLLPFARYMRGIALAVRDVVETKPVGISRPWSVHRLFSLDEARDQVEVTRHLQTQGIPTLATASPTETPERLSPGEVISIHGNEPQDPRPSSAA